MRSRSLFALLPCFFLTLMAQAAPTDAKAGLQFSAELTYVAAGKEVTATHQFELDPKSSSWIPLTEVKDGVILLGRVAEWSGTTVKIESMLLDTNVRPHRIVNTPNITAQLGEPATISVLTESEKLAVTLSARQLPPKPAFP